LPQGELRTAGADAQAGHQFCAPLSPPDLAAFFS